MLTLSRGLPAHLRGSLLPPEEQGPQGAGPTEQDGGSPAAGAAVLPSAGGTRHCPQAPGGQHAPRWETSAPSAPGGGLLWKSELLSEFKDGAYFFFKPIFG